MTSIVTYLGSHDEPIIQSSDGYHLGFMPIYRWVDLTGVEHVHHGKIYRSEASAEAAARTPGKPESWASFTWSIGRCSTRFERGTRIIFVPERIFDLINAPAGQVAA